MTNYEIQIGDIEPFFDLSIDISDVEYILEFAWNNEGSFWTVSMFTTDKTPIFTGRKLVLNYDLFSYCSSKLHYF